MRLVSGIGFGLCLVLAVMGCERKNATSGLKRAVPNDSANTSLIKIPSLVSGYELILKTANYQTMPATPIGYRIACSVPAELDKLLTGIGIDPRLVPNLPLAYTDPANPAADVVALKWQDNPEIRCPSNRPSPQSDTDDKIVLRRSQQNDRTFFYLQVTQSSNAAKVRNLYELGCQGLVEGMGFSLLEAAIIDPQSFIQGSQGRIIDMNCPNGQVADLIPFVAECEKARGSSSPDEHDEAYNELFARMQEGDFNGTTCTELWNHLKPLTELDLNDLQISSLAPVRYLTRLTRLKARNNYFTDVTPVSNVSNLRELDLGFNVDLADFTPLSSLKSLESLKLDQTSAGDLQALASLKKLLTLDISKTLVRLPNLDALKNLRLEEVKRDGLNLVWRASEQTFFTNCLGLKLLPEAERSSFIKVLNAYGATVDPGFEVSPSCFVLYRSVSKPNLWPELDLTQDMHFELGSPPIKTCLKTNVLTSLNGLPAAVKLDYESCPLTQNDLLSLVKIQQLSYLNLKGTSLIDLSALGTHPKIKDMVLHVEGLEANPSTCPTTTGNLTLDTYCRERRAFAIEATKDVHVMGRVIQNLDLATVTSSLPSTLISYHVSENSCSGWLSVSPSGKAYGVFPDTTNSCDIKLFAKIGTETSATVSTRVVNGTPKIVQLNFHSPVAQGFENLELAQSSAPAPAPRGSIVATGGSCSMWLRVKPNGKADGKWASPGLTCDIELRARSDYGESAPITLTLKLARWTESKFMTGYFNEWCSVFNGEVYCWEIPQFSITPGQFSFERKRFADMTNAVQVSFINSSMRCVLLDDGRVMCAGIFYRALPNGSTVIELADTPRIVDGFDGIVQIAAGVGYFCGLRADQQVLCWGRNDRGQIGLDPQTNPNVGRPQLVAGLSSVTSLVSGYASTCAIKDDGSAWCWGDNNAGQLGNNQTGNSHVPQQVQLVDQAQSLALGGNTACAILKDRTVQCWGESTIGQTGGTPSTSLPRLLPNLNQVTEVSVGAGSVCALSQGRVFCWGSNWHGQSGSGDTGTSIFYLPTRVQRNFSNVVALGGGVNTNCAMDLDADERNIYCWGVLAGAPNGLISPYTVSPTPVLMGVF